jgi:hypothetical protein
MKVVEKNRAISLRKRGESIGVIAKKIGVSKASVSVWVREVHLTVTQLQILKGKGFSSVVVEKRRRSRLLNEQLKRDMVMKEPGKAISSITKHDLRLIGLCLYWGEGSKTHQGVARVSNSDPAVIRVMMRFFREICLVEEKDFRGHVHTHSHLNISRAERHWAVISGISRENFYKTYAKPSSASKGKKDNLPYGTFDIYVCRTKLFLQILGQIEKLKKLLGAGSI